MIWLAWQTFATEKLYVGLFVVSSLGLLSHFVLKRLEKRLIPWRSEIEKR
jgi:ABC-type nitrate/sulfonate/bicarbonate transport system permease component